MQRTPDLHFTYEEEAAAEDFFVPYIWTLVVSSTSLPWNSRSISLFAPSGQDVSGAPRSEAQQQPAARPHLSTAATHKFRSRALAPVQHMCLARRKSQCSLLYNSSTVEVQS